VANILAVDDNLELCKLIRTALERDGHRVETRQAGGALTEALCRWADCILLDVMMPGEDGFAVCRRIRSLTEAPILFLSARTDEAAVLEAVKSVEKVQKATEGMSVVKTILVKNKLINLIVKPAK
jgi:DNA-binding response OmpR family regulator